MFRVCLDGRLDGVLASSASSASNLVTSRSCIVPLKCKTSQWSDWRLEANCSQRIRRLVRSRSILRPPQGEGRPCPHLTEYKQGHDLEQSGIVLCFLIDNGEQSFVLTADFPYYLKCRW